MTIENIAKICHQANKAYCSTHGDDSHLEWEDSPGWVKDSAVNGLYFLYENPNQTPESMHENWKRVKLEDGWIYGEVKDAELKTHPCIVNYEDLPQFQRIKDEIYLALARTLLPYVE